MRRAHWLAAIIVVALTTAVGLRVRSQWVRPQVRLVAKGSPSTQPVPLPMPRDYVVEPLVSPDEVGNGPHRIISLAPSITEILCALGLRDRLAARSHKYYRQYSLL